MIAGVLAGVGYGSWIARGIADPIQAYEQVVKTVTVTTPAATSTAPVMDRIAMCESHNSQYCTAELVKLKMCHSYEVGQVLHRTNSDGTIDTGVDQINSIWGATAAKLGYNLDVEKDNRAFGDWIYKNKGTGDWAASQSCWKR